MKKAVICKILKNKEIAKDIYEIFIEKKGTLVDSKAGQFLHIKCDSQGSLLRRPISISSVEDDSLRLVIRQAGKGTEEICRKKEGDLLDVLGPLGNGFSIDQNENSIIIGGGIGVAPLLQVAKEMNHKNTKILLGYRSDPYLVEEFKKYGHVEVATEDGSNGYRGYVVDLLENIADEKVHRVYACGPEVMLKVVQRICKEKNISSQLSVEEKMACGVGTCLVCVCKLKKEKNPYATTCKDGPVFDGDLIVFD
ncbi:dihydroorotate dehydrogenase electron transfer subunit [Inediibacterium massiliense]|uniref:dihydroorotate dehydrogenase electron transfer subunit n=1 Tax=Inediibacterium massiliense TaxID=1658111 RepID=UPI0006B4AF5A|nr:dihydroorotate dehydrogenase electron transfer subunit [Inediibacterium massiliense]